MKFAQFETKFVLRMLKFIFLIGISSLSLSESAELFFQCGKRAEDTTSTITGGFDAKDKDWPWHAAIFHYDDTSLTNAYKCGGVLISNLWVLTAAHCVTDQDTFDPLPADYITTQFGQYRLKGYSAHSQTRNVSHVYVHDSYEEKPHMNDIALLFLSNSLNLATDFVKPVCVSTFNVESMIGNSGTVVGWGYTSIDAQVADNLKAANLPIVEHVKCIESNRQTYGRLLAGGMFCAGHLNGTAACNGDSGGGLYINNGDSWYVAGIVSFTVVKKTYNDQKVCSPDDYAVFTDVNHFKDWIDSTQLVMHPSISERNAKANVIRWLEFWRKSMRCGWYSIGIPVMDPLKYEKIEFTGTGTNGIKLWMHFDDITIKNMRHFEIEDIKIARFTEQSVDIQFHFHLDKLVIEGNTVEGRLMEFIEFKKHGSYSAKMFDVEIKGKAHYIFLESGDMRIDSLKIQISADDITTKIDDITDNPFLNMMFNSALSSILPDILKDNQELLSDAIENFSLPKLNSLRNEGMTLESFIKPPPKRNPFFENPC